MTNKELIAEAQALDPEPWVSPNNIRYTHPANNTYTFDPRLGYAQAQEDYR
jgi:hypothetical protein